MSGIVNNAGLPGSQSGVITSTTSPVVDASKYSWHIYRSANLDQASNGTLDFDSHVLKGSGITESGGGITVDAQGGGVYWVSFQTSNSGAAVNDHDWKLYVDGSQINGTRLYFSVQSTSNIDHMGKSMSIACKVDNSETITVYGNGTLQGGAASMTRFSGFRMGEYLTGNI